MKIHCWCGEFVDKDKDLHRLSYYRVKTPTIQYTRKNERIIEEYFYTFVCNKCLRDVVYIVRRARNAIGGRKAVMPEILVGLSAIEYLQKTENNRINKTHELTHNPQPYSRVMDLCFGKTINSTTQRRRFVNETGWDGGKIENEVILIK